MDLKKPYRAILIAGPTASGKSALAVRLAERYGGVVINADSMQVYAELSILTARPGPTEMGVVPHALYGHASGAAAYSVALWLKDVAAVLEACRAEGQVPVITGGTGLYFKALTEGLSPIPPIPPAIRAHWRAEAAQLGAARLHEILGERDPDTAGGLRPTDTQRLTRALEVFDGTGRGLSSWQSEPGVPLIAEEDALRLVVSLDRAELHRRADARFDRMMDAGAVEEVRALVAKGYATDLPVMRALGVAPLASALAGAMSLEASREEAKRDTRHYIRRQETWLRRNMISWNALKTKDMERIDGLNFTFTLH